MPNNMEYKNRACTVKLSKKHMQGKCPLCNGWLEKNVYQTINGHKFHRECLSEMASTGERCILCVEDNILPGKDCQKLKDADIFEDHGAMRDLGNAEVKCQKCGCVGTFKEIKKVHDEDGCNKVDFCCTIC